MWAHRCLSEKNRLTAADAQRVEESFQAKLASFATPAEEISETVGPNASPVAPLDKGAGWPKYRTQADVINKALLALPEPRRLRDKVHLKWVAKQPCLICGRRPSDAHHLRYAQHPALGRKVSDEFTVPIYTIPARGRFAANGQREEFAQPANVQIPRGVAVASGSGWYHDEAIQAEQRRKN